MSKTIAVIGAGSWGTTLAELFGRKNEVRLWCYDPAVAEEVAREHRNSSFTQDLLLSPNVRPETDINKSVASCDFVVFVVPSKFFSATLETLDGLDCPAVSATKGFLGTHQTPSQFLKAKFPDRSVATLLGPNIAKEFWKHDPALTTVSSDDAVFATEVADTIRNDRLLVTVGNDPVGAEIAATLKNPLAIVSGLSNGLGFGANTQAALLMIGLQESKRFAGMFGASPDSVFEPSALGDLFCTCTSTNSRNFTCGFRLSKGETLDHIVSHMNGMVAEGVETTKHVMHIAAEHGADFPLFSALNDILFNEANPREALFGIWNAPDALDASRSGTKNTDVRA